MKIWSFCAGPVTPSSSPTAPFASAPGRRSAVQRLAEPMLRAAVAFAVFTTLIALIRVDLRPPEGDAPRKTLDVHVAWNSTAVEIVNNSMPAGGELSVYINGMPSVAYRADSRMPAVGEAVHIPLRAFVTRRGDRFDPGSEPVTVVWVGGEGFSYEPYRKE
jgi:hypothetical protein